MGALITPDELPRWVPGDLTLDSTDRRWESIRLRGYRYAPSDVPVPALKDYMLVIYREGATPMYRRCNGDWRSEQVRPGSISLLTHAAPSHWRWSEAIEVVHLYLSPAAVAATAAEIYERAVHGVDLRDVLRADDSVLAGIVTCLVQEARQDGPGSRLYVESLTTFACTHILRHYADVRFPEAKPRGGLSPGQRRLVADYVDENLDRSLSLADLAGVAGLSLFHFTRAFRCAFGCPPHVYVVQRRLASAKRLLARPGIPLKVVAAQCGFADQSHMTRLFRRLLGVTPAEYRRQAVG
ncbi:AraC family transcriptional regulator [Methylobacterium sp. ID0610]|uniref:AraC family transcriptional regulator n=1 Tax=Methylobacterium carpenticola TaxID=3344827 RepID=UPI00369BC8C6